MCEISIWPLRKTWPYLLENPCWHSQRSSVSCSWSQVCTHLWRGLVSLLFADPLQVIKVLRLTFGNSNLQFPSQTSMRLAGPLQDFFLSHSFVALAVCFGSLSCRNTHPRPIFNALALTVHGPVHRPFDAVQLSCPLSRKSIMFPPPCLTVLMVFLGSFLLLQTWRVELMPKSWMLVSSDDKTFTQFSSESLANFSTCAFLRFQSFTA